jgi:hypothetical protein
VARNGASSTARRAVVSAAGSRAVKHTFFATTSLRSCAPRSHALCSLGVDEQRVARRVRLRGGNIELGARARQLAAVP